MRGRERKDRDEGGREGGRDGGMEGWRDGGTVVSREGRRRGKRGEKRGTGSGREAKKMKEQSVHLQLHYKELPLCDSLNGRGHP